MMALRPPFKAENMDKLYNKVVKGQYGKISDNYSDDMKEIIKFLLKVNPKDRPSCSEILNHPLVKKRIEFFNSEFDIDDNNMDEGVLLRTIRVPKNILFLTDKLPVANYSKEKSNKKNNNNVDNNNHVIDKKKYTFPNSSLPDIKSQIKIKSNNHSLNKDKLKKYEDNYLMELEENVKNHTISKSPDNLIVKEKN